MEPSLSSPVPLATPTTLSGRLANIYAAPGEVFEELKGAEPSVANWLVPILVCIAAGFCFVFTVFSQEAILQQIREQQVKAIQLQVSSGKITKAQAEQGEQMMEKLGPMVMKVTAAVMTVIMSFFTPFIWAVVVVVLAKCLKQSVPYMKVVEMTGLASMVLALGVLISLLLAFIFGRLACGPSPALALSEVDFTNKGHMALAALNVINLWYTALVALAFRTMTGVSYGKAFGLIFGFWIVVRALFIAAGQGQFVL